MIETIDSYQLHLIAFQLSSTNQWAPYLMIEKFDDRLRDFTCVLPRQRVGGDSTYASEEEAIEEARRYGNRLVSDYLNLSN